MKKLILTSTIILLLGAALPAAELERKTRRNQAVRLNNL